MGRVKKLKINGPCTVRFCVILVFFIFLMKILCCGGACPFPDPTQLQN